MGATQSVPIPSNADFLVPHKPLPVPPLFNDKDSNSSPDSSSSSSTESAEYSFVVPKDAWNKGASLELTPLSRANDNDHNHSHNDDESKQDEDHDDDDHHHHHPHHKIIKIVPLPDNHHQQCLITNVKGVVLAVLKVQDYQCIQICTLNHHSSGGETVTPVVVGQYQGHPLYEYAVVTENYQKHNYHHTLSLSAAAETTATYQMAQCGHTWFGRPMGIVVQRHEERTHDAATAATAAAANDNSKHKKPKDTLVGAYLTHQSPRKMWACRASPGVDPVLLAALVVCSDKQRNMFRSATATAAKLE